MSNIRFSIGQIVATPGALMALADAQQSPLEFLARHERGDWGDLSEEDEIENERAVAGGFRIPSAYKTRVRQKILITTEADRLVTTILLATED